MLKKINISIRISMVLVVVLSLINYFFKLELKAVPAPLFATFNMILVVVLTFLPKIMRKMDIEISNGLYYLILFSVMVSFVGGMGFKLYQIINNYDTIIHFFNGGVIAIFGFAFIRSQFEDWHEYIMMIAVGALLVSISVGAIWEIYEFVADLITKGNMQRYEDIFTPDGIPIPFIGQKALMDTMIDIIVDTLGGVIASVMMYRSAVKNGKLSNIFAMTHINNEIKEKLN